MNQELIVGFGLIAMAYVFIFSNSPDPQARVDNSDYLIEKYGLTESEYRTFTYIADPIKRDQYLNHVIRSKQKY